MAGLIGVNVRTRATRRVALLAVLAAAIGGGLAALGSENAAAAGQPDLAITQHISGSSQPGHLFDTLFIRNNGTAAATHVNIEILETMASSSPFGDVFSGGASCEVMPAPAPYDYATACQLVDPIAAGAAQSLKGDFSGTTGVKFTTLAQVGEFQADANRKDNSSSRTTYFGPGADLRVRGTLKTGTKKGHATGVVHVGNRGPNDASSVQEVLEMKHVSGAKATGGGSCQIIPAAKGYSLAASCVRASLVTGSVWTLTFDFAGTSGKRITVVTSATSQTTDPNPANNKITRRAVLK
jgi:hypothetical protein